MITANQILKKLQEKVWGKDKALAEAAANSIKKNGMPYSEFLKGLATVDQKKPETQPEAKLKAKKATVRKPRAKQKVTTQRKTG